MCRAISRSQMTWTRERQPATTRTPEIHRLRPWPTVLPTCGYFSIPQIEQSPRSVTSDDRKLIGATLWLWRFLKNPALFDRQEKFGSREGPFQFCTRAWRGLMHPTSESFACGGTCRRPCQIFSFEACLQRSIWQNTNGPVFLLIGGFRAKRWYL